MNATNSLSFLGLRFAISLRLELQTSRRLFHVLLLDHYYETIIYYLYSEKILFSPSLSPKKKQKKNASRLRYVKYKSCVERSSGVRIRWGGGIMYRSRSFEKRGEKEKKGKRKKNEGTHDNVAAARLFVDSYEPRMYIIITQSAGRANASHG